VSNAGAFAQRVLAAARRVVEDRHTAQDRDIRLLEQIENVDLSEAFVSTENNEDDAEEYEEDIDESEESRITLRDDFDARASFDVTVSDIEYKSLAREFMTTLMDNSLSENKPWPEQDQRCPLCLVDPFADQDAKDRVWPSPAKLREHMRSQKHVPYGEWEREIKAQYDMGCADEWACPYGGGDPDEVFDTFDELVDHIERSTVENTSMEHEELKAEAGWLDEFWHGEPTASAKRNKANRQKRKLSAGGYVARPEAPQLPGPVPHDTVAGVQLGYFGDFDEEPPAGSGIIRVSGEELAELSSNQALPPHLAGFIDEVDFDEFVSRIRAETIPASRTDAMAETDFDDVA
jgi:hypothetical protein